MPYKDPERSKQWRKEYYQKNKAKNLERCKKWREDNVEYLKSEEFREKARNRSRERYHNNIEHEREMGRIRAKRNRDNNPELYRKIRRECTERHKDRINEERRNETRGNKEYNEKMRNYHFLKKYGITEEDFQLRFKDQNYSCKICSKYLKDEIRKNIHVDHDHQTGALRDILCRNCNLGLGNFKDNIGVMELALNYLRFHQCKN